MASLELYHYIDEEGLDSLYDQCVQFLVESLGKVEKAGKIDGGAEIQARELLSMAGLSGVEVDGQFSLNRLKSESFEAVFPVEQRISLILDYLEEQEEDFCEFTQASDITEGVEKYILIESVFQTPDFKEVLEKSKVDSTQFMFAAFFGNKDLLKPQGFVKFTSQTNVGRITMGTSLAKYRTGLQHLMTMWQSTEGGRRKVRLRVFGYLTETDVNEYYLKPFAIAQAK